MAKEKEEETGIVAVSKESGYGLKLPDGEVADLSAVDAGITQVLAYLVKTVSEIKKNIG